MPEDQIGNRNQALVPVPDIAPTPTEETSLETEGPNFQLEFEKLLRESLEKGNDYRAESDEIKVSLQDGGEVTYHFYASGRPMPDESAIPKGRSRYVGEVGLKMDREENSADLNLWMVLNRPKIDGLSVDPKFDFAEGDFVWGDMPGIKQGERDALDQLFVAQMVQALANVYQRPVTLIKSFVDPMQAISFKEAEDKKPDGYREIEGVPDWFTKVFHPQTPALDAPVQEN